MVLTTTMLKKCVRVPKLYLDGSSLQSEKDLAAITERRKNEAFKRGAMMFEDYNYGLYNKYIMIDPYHIESDDEIKAIV